MAVWRTKACELFGRKPGTYSYKLGVVPVADDLFDALVRAVSASDAAMIERIFDYALWADRQQKAGHLQSAVDILFFMKLFDGGPLEAEAAKRLPADMLEAKRTMAAGIVE